MVYMTTKENQSVQVRLGKESYELVRSEAYRRHKPMTDILEEMIQYFKEENLTSLSEQ